MYKHQLFTDLLSLIPHLFSPSWKIIMSCNSFGEPSLLLTKTKKQNNPPPCTFETFSSWWRITISVIIYFFIFYFAGNIYAVIRVHIHNSLLIHVLKINPSFIRTCLSSRGSQVYGSLSLVTLVFANFNDCHPFLFLLSPRPRPAQLPPRHVSDRQIRLQPGSRRQGQQGRCARRLQQGHQDRWAQPGHLQSEFGYITLMPSRHHGNLVAIRDTTAAIFQMWRPWCLLESMLGVPQRQLVAWHAHNADFSSHFAMSQSVSMRKKWEIVLLFCSSS